MSVMYATAKSTSAAPRQDAERFRKSAAKYIKSHAATKESALAFLVATGTHTKTGRLKKPYK